MQTQTAELDLDFEVTWKLRRREPTVEFSEDRGRFEAENLNPRDRDKLLTAGFRWDRLNAVLFAPSDEIALAGMEVL